MSNKTDKLRKFKKNVINRHPWDEEEGRKIVEDFLQVSKIAEELKTTNEKAFIVFMTLLKDKISLIEDNIERGKRNQ